MSEDDECIYCRDYLPEPITVVEDGCSTASMVIALYDKRIECVITADLDNWAVRADVNFCPMCGRKLRGDD